MRSVSISLALAAAGRRAGKWEIENPGMTDPDAELLALIAGPLSPRQ
jgi:hypothetical protein